MTKRTVSSLGEDELIRRVSRRIRTDRSVHRGIGDDCAVLEGPPGKWALFASDMLVEGVHFRSSAVPQQVGWKALAVNVSDIAAMGGVPRHAVISIGLPPDTSLRWVEKFYEGLTRCARTFGVNLVGGDTNRSPRLVIDAAIWGEVEKSKVVYRSGARPGDWILVTGRLGGSLKSGRHLTFVPRLPEARAVLSRARPTAMMDLSDGLAADLTRLCRASRVSAAVKTEFILRNKGCSLRQAVTDGEDFELLMTVRPKDALPLLKWALRALPCALTPIGRITARKLKGPAIRWFDRSSREVTIKGKEFRHF